MAFQGKKSIFIVEIMMLVIMLVSNYNSIYSFARPISKPANQGAATPIRPDLPAEDDVELNQAAYSGPMNLAPQSQDDFGDVLIPETYKEPEPSDKDIGNRIKLKQRPGKQQAADKYKDDVKEDSGPGTPEKSPQGTFKWD